MKRQRMTPREREALEAIRAHQREKGEIPTRDEIAGRLGVVRSGNTHRILAGLKDKGYITITPHTARGIEVVR